MAELLSPGVIIQEVPFGPQPIEGVSTSTAGFVGEALRGPTAGAPTLVTSFQDFERKFGGLVSSKVLGYAVQGFFDNGGRRAYIARVVHEATASAGALAVTNVGGNLVSILGSITLVAANQYLMTLSSTVGLGLALGGLTLMDRTTGAAVPGLRLQATSVDPNTGVVAVTASSLPPAPPPPLPVLTGLSGQRYFVRIGDVPGGATSMLALAARDKGSFSARMAALVDAVLLDRTQIQLRITDPNVYQFADVSFLRAGQRLQLHMAGQRVVVGISSVNYGTRQVTLAANPGADYTGGTAYLVGWRFATTFDGAAVETLTISAPTAELQAELEARSTWLRLTAAAAVDPASATGYPTFALALPQQFSPGTDDAVDADDIVGSVLARRGIGALEGQDGINIIAAPWKPPTSGALQVVTNALISQAERLQDRFAIFDSLNQENVNQVLLDRGLFNSQYAAMYHPWIRVRDPIAGTTLELPSAGHVAGAYARTDNDRGVFKAPANVVLRNVLGFTRDVTTGEQDVLNPQGVNVLRRFDGLGLVIWGARTVTADTLWKYVPVRRLFIFIEQSIVRGTRYAVFEPNAPPLWARIRDSVANFLTTQWRDGALFGNTPSEAFFVKVDETTTTQTDRDNGRVNIIVGIAPVKPAEFVVFQIGQAPSSVIIAEQS